MYRLFHGTIAMLAALAALCLCGCGGGGGSHGSNGAKLPISAATVTGTLTDPTGSSSVNVITMTGTGSVSAGGNFSVSAPTNHNATLGIAETTAGTPVALGWIDPTSETQELSPKSTADVLCFYAVGAAFLPSSTWSSVRQMISQDPSVATLADQITSALTADHRALIDGNSTIHSALLTAANALRQNTTLEECKNAIASASNSMPSTRGIVNSDGVTQKHGLSCILDDNLNTFHIVNDYRRRGWMYIDKIRDVYTDGSEKAYSPVQPVDADGTRVDTTNGLNGTIGSLVDIIRGNAAYVPKAGSPVTLTSSDSPSEDKLVRYTEYRVLVIGPGLKSETDSDAMDALKTSEARELRQNQLTLEWFFGDIMTPMVLSVFGSVLDDYKVDIASAEPDALVGSLTDVFSKSVDINNTLNENSDFNGALDTTVQTIATNGAVRESLCKALYSYISLPSGVNGIEVSQIQSAFSNVLSALRITDIIASGVDIAAVSAHFYKSGVADVWTMRITTPTVAVSPASQDVLIDQHCGLTATATDCNKEVTSNITYIWQYDSQLGTLKMENGDIVLNGAGGGDCKKVFFYPDSSIDQETTTTIRCLVKAADSKALLGKGEATVRIVPNVGNGVVKGYVVHSEDAVYHYVHIAAGVQFNLVPHATKYRISATGLTDGAIANTLPRDWTPPADINYWGNPAGTAFLDMTGGSSSTPISVYNQQEHPADSTLYADLLTRFAGATFTVRAIEFDNN